MIRYDPDEAARLIRMTLADKMIKQVWLSRSTGVRQELLNRFLNRRINLLDCDIEKICKELEIEDRLKLNARISGGRY